MKRIVIFLVAFCVVAITDLSAQRNDNKVKNFRQLELGLFGPSLGYHQQFARKFSFLVQASAGTRIDRSSADGSRQETALYFNPYLLGELRYYPLHKEGQSPCAWFRPVDGLYASLMGSYSPVSLYSRPKYSMVRGIYPLAAVMAGYQVRFLRYAFANVSVGYGFRYNQILSLDGFYSTEYDTGIMISGTLGVAIPLNKEQE